MKKVKRLIKLTNLNEKHLSETELSRVNGREGNCACGCFYCSCGGSTYTDNYGANSAGDKISPLPPETVVCGVCV